MKRHTLQVRILSIAILFLAAFLRLWNLDATEFKYDEARVCNLAAHFVDTGSPPVRGMGSSTGIDNPPLAVYLISLPVLFSRDPLVAAAFVALMNVLAVWGCYWLGQRYWNVGVGLLSATLLAVSPWAVFYSRKVWAQDLLLPWVILFFALLLAWLVDGRRWALSGAIVTLAALTQIHLATLAFVPLLALILLFTFSQAISLWKPLLVGVGIGVLLYAPYFIFDALTGWQNVRSSVELMKTPAQTSWEVVRFALLNVGGREIHALAGPERFREFLDGIVNLAYWPDRIEEILAAIGVLYLPFRWWRKRQEPQAFRRDGLLFLWLVTPVLFYLRSKSTVHPHYLIPLYPAPYLALAIAAVDLLRSVAAWPKAQKPVYALGTLVLAALIVWQGYLSLSIRAFVETHDTPHGMGTPIGIYRSVMRTVKSYANKWDNKQVIVLCSGDDPRWTECPAVFHFMAGRALDVRFVDRDSSLLFPRSDVDTLVVLAPGESIAATALPRHAESLPNESIPLREGIGEYRFYRLSAGYAPQPVVQPSDAPVRLANGVSLLGYDLAGPFTPGQTARLTLHWRVDAIPANPPAQGYSFANHLLAANGQRYGQRDGPGYHVGHWRVGDVLVSWFDIELADQAPPAPYHLRTGMYVYTPPDQFITIPIVDAAGQPIADAVEWHVE